MKKLLSPMIRLVAVHLSMLLAATTLDLMLVGFMAFTVTCFAVAGVFSAILCHNILWEQVASVNSKKVALYTMIPVLLTCALLFFLVAPLSGAEYELPLQSFAVTESLTTVFCWKNQIS